MKKNCVTVLVSLFLLLYAFSLQAADQINQSKDISMEPFSYQEVKEAIACPSKSPEFITASDGIQLALYPFIAKHEQSVLIFYHGGGIWSNGLYQAMAQQLSEQQTTVYLVDIRGHGNSGGPRGDAPSKEQVWQDIDSVIAFVRAQHRIAKLFLGGHSSGAGLVLNYSNQKKESAVDGYVFLAPYLGSNAGTNRQHADKRLEFVKKIKLFPLIINAISGGYLCGHWPVVFFNYSVAHKKQDPFILDYYTAAMAMAVFPYDADKIFAKLDKPFVLLIGQKDEQFIPEKVISFKEYAIKVTQTSSAQILANATHLSVVLESVKEIAEFINKK